MNSPAVDRRRMSPSGRRFAVRAVTAGLAALVGVAGCSGKAPAPATPAAASTPATIALAAPSTPVASPSPTFTPGDPQGLGVQVEVTGPPGATAEQQAVLRPWTTYWQISVQAFNTYGSSMAAGTTWKTFEEVATGNALSQTLRGISYQKTKKVHTVGTASFSVTSVTITGGQAVIRGCVDDRTYEVNGQGVTTKPAPGRSLFADVLTRTGASWLVSDIPNITASCPA